MDTLATIAAASPPISPQEPNVANQPQSAKGWPSPSAVNKWEPLKYAHITKRPSEPLGTTPPCKKRRIYKASASGKTTDVSSIMFKGRDVGGLFDENEKLRGLVGSLVGLAPPTDSVGLEQWINFVKSQAISGRSVDPTAKPKPQPVATRNPTPAERERAAQKIEPSLAPNDQPLAQSKASLDELLSTTRAPPPRGSDVMSIAEEDEDEDEDEVPAPEPAPAPTSEPAPAPAPEPAPAPTSEPAPAPAPEPAPASAPEPAPASAPEPNPERFCIAGKITTHPESGLPGRYIWSLVLAIGEDADTTKPKEKLVFIPLDNGTIVLVHDIDGNAWKRVPYDGTRVSDSDAEWKSKKELYCSLTAAQRRKRVTINKFPHFTTLPVVNYKPAPVPVRYNDGDVDVTFDMFDVEHFCSYNPERGGYVAKFTGYKDRQFFGVRDTLFGFQHLEREFWSRVSISR